MNSRVAVLGGVALLIAAGGAWWQIAPGTTPDAVTFNDSTENSIPVPPVPPRVAEGAQYERCLEMIDRDPVGAAAFADSWDTKGGGDGAMHCRALAQIAGGDPEDGADALEALAKGSTAPLLARATIYDQAVQAWMIAGEPERAHAAATAALALEPDDADRLIARSAAAAALDRFAEATRDLDRALELEPRRVDALVQRAAAWREDGRLDRAKADVDLALRLDPSYPDGLLERGIQRQRLGDDGGARTDWERIVQIDPDSPTADLAQQNLALLNAGPQQR